ncbi:MucB/RseB C-terminal domain-containing protein [Marinobacter sp. 71-i]|uniref:MucB/RseB C-terminal domain-containing protein n=1 Tax=Marinobacter iranensis TaxID=2962607 RepID=A0ABT5YE22_9GAMM|nr:MucB/RseB C-terminal domain-containing protein [Marinobacter iranensis]MDF0751938.1 MucB/RseB C-terminal domain-containing protein [Marinobacter iranensis]
MRRTVTGIRSRLPSVGRRWLILLALFVGLVWQVSARSAEDAERDAEYWLGRLGPALNMTSYRGVFVYARGDQVSSMRIAHRYRDGMVEERLVPQDGASGEIVRKGMRVVCVLPDHGRIQLDQVIPSGPFAEAFSSQLMPVTRWYQPELVGDDRIAGYDVVKLGLRAKDELRYSHQLWLEKSTGLLVKSHVRSVGGEVLEHFQFTSLEITDSLPDSEFVIRTEGEAIKRNLTPEEASSPAPRMDGWTLQWRPDGFVPAAAPRSGEGQAVAFSDGMAAFSVFVEPARKMVMPTGASRIGATTVYMKQLDVDDVTFFVTVVGEIPPTTARKVAESVKVDDTLAFGAVRQ